MKKVLKTILNVVIWIFVAVAAASVVLAFSAQANADGVPTLFGKSIVCIQSDSMKDTFSKGDLILDDQLKAKEKINLKKGDVITFKTDLDGNGTIEYNTHRIIKKYVKEDGYTYYDTKGDNNSLKDANPVRYDFVIAKYSGTKYAGVGTVIDFLQTSTGFLCVIVLPLALFFIYELYNFIRALIAAKASKAVATNEDEIKKAAVEEYLRQQEAEKAAAAATAETSESIEKDENADE